MSKKIALFIVILIVLFTSIAAFLSTKLEFDYNFENFFPKNDADLDYFLEYRQVFENDNDYILIAIGDENGIFSTDFLQKAAAFTEELENTNHVVSVLSPTNIQQPIVTAFGYMEIPLLHINEPEKYANDSIRISKSKEYINTLFAPDFKSICIVVNNTQIITKKASDELYYDIEALLQKYNFSITHYAGKIRGQKAYLTIMKQELILFLSISLGLVILFLALSFRSLFGVIVPVITVLIAIIITLGIMKITGKYLDLMTTLLPTILFVVGMSDAVHILNRYIEELRNGLPKLEAIKITFKEVGWATFLTSITTAVGFLTLMAIRIVPVKEFGLYSAIGVIVAFFVAITLLPALLSLIKPPRISARNEIFFFWNKWLHKLFVFTLKKSKWIVGIYILLIASSFVGISILKIDYRLLEDLSEKNPLQQDFRFFENSYSGIRPFEMAVSLKDTSLSFFDYEVIKELDQVENYLYNHYKARFLASPVAVVKSLNKALNNGNSNFYRIPKNEKEYQKIKKALKKPRLQQQLTSIVSKKKNMARFTGKMDDVGSYKVAQLNADFEVFFNTLNSPFIDYRMTGTALLVDKNNGFLAINMVVGLGVAFLLIALLMGFLFKSIKMAFVSLIPNVIPLLLIAGIMGFSGTNINMSTSIIFTIAFGIAVDDSIHFLSKYKIQLTKRSSPFFALRRSFLSTGKAIILTSLILCGGFLSLIFSDFKSTFLIGVYITLTLLLAVISDLLLLPILLSKQYNKKN
ncbi:MAG: MMPL family transporter [Vicingaceae bacterium]|nr:MMPL family transporter [Vicingaceae bacterium]